MDTQWQLLIRRDATPLYSIICQSIEELLTIYTRMANFNLFAICRSVSIADADADADAGIC